MYNKYTDKDKDKNNTMWNNLCCYFCNSKHRVIKEENIHLKQSLFTIEDPPIEWKNTIPFIPPVTTGQVIKVYDGDTITIAAKIAIPNSPLYRFSVRLNGIDAPEIKGRNEDEKESALKARHALEKLILHKVVQLKNTKTEKYGRILADVYLDSLHINQWLLDEKLVVPYDGATKQSPASWIEYNKKNSDLSSITIITNGIY